MPFLKRAVIVSAMAGGVALIAACGPLNDGPKPGPAVTTSSHTQSDGGPSSGRTRTDAPKPTAPNRTHVPDRDGGSGPTTRAPRRDGGSGPTTRTPHCGISGDPLCPPVKVPPPLLPKW
jgi:hypothetical protein